MASREERKEEVKGIFNYFRCCIRLWLGNNDGSVRQFESRVGRTNRQERLHRHWLVVDTAGVSNPQQDLLISG